MDAQEARKQILSETRKRDTFEHNNVELQITEWSVEQWERFQKIEAWDMRPRIELAMECVTTPDGQEVFNKKTDIDTLMEGPARPDALGRKLNLEMLKINGLIDDEEPAEDLDRETLKALAHESESPEELGEAIIELLGGLSADEEAGDEGN
jgi:hypothetical protein